MFGSDELIQYGNCNSTSWQPMSLHEMAEMMRAFKEQDDLRKSHTYFQILNMEPCQVCGEKVEYKEGPPEHFVMCRHIASHIPRAEPKPSTFGFPDLFGMAGMPVVFK